VTAHHWHLMAHLPWHLRRPPGRRLRTLRRVQRFNRRVWDWQGRRRERVRHRLGYRGLVLLMFGIIYFCIGLSVINAHDYQPELVHTHLPIWFRVTLWCVPGLVSVAVCLDHKWQALGFGMLFVPPAERAVSYTVAAITVPTLTRIPAALIYLVIVLTVTIIASWPEPTNVEKRVLDQADGDLTETDGGKHLDGNGVLRNGDDDRGSAGGGAP
jgi:hypothetical protein